MTDWFNNNAPKANAGDWFTANAPSSTSSIPPTPKPPNPIMSAAEEPGLLTGPIATQAHWTPGASELTSTGGDPAAQQTLAREVKAGISSVAGIPRGIYHAFADKPTDEESAQFGGPQEVSGPKRIGLGIHRLTTEPVQTAADWYSQAAQGKVPNATDQALSVAPEAVGTGAGQVALAGAGKALMSRVVRPAVSGATEFLGEKAPGRMVNQLIRPTKQTMSYGRNPGEAIANEGITAGSIGELGDNVENKISDLQAELHGKFGNAAAQAVDTSQAVLDPIDREISAAMQGRVANKPLLNSLTELRDSITHELTPEGARGNPKNLVMTPFEALDFKRDIGRLTRWTPENAANYNELNSLKREIYHNLDTQLDQVAPGTEELNDRMSNLISAKSAIERVTPVLERHADAFHRYGFPMIFALEELARTGNLERAVGGAALGVGTNMASDFVKGTRATTYGAQALRGAGKGMQAAADAAQEMRPSTSAAVRAGTAGASLSDQAWNAAQKAAPNTFQDKKRK